jgi:hypothetical protein
MEGKRDVVDADIADYLVSDRPDVMLSLTNVLSRLEIDRLSGGGVKEAVGHQCAKTESGALGRAERSRIQAKFARRRRGSNFFKSRL